MREVYTETAVARSAEPVRHIGSPRACQGEKYLVARNGERMQEEAEVLMGLSDVLLDVEPRVVIPRHNFQRPVYRDGLQIAALTKASLEEEGRSWMERTTERPVAVSGRRGTRTVSLFGRR